MTLTNIFLKPIVAAPGHGETFHVLGETIIVKMSGEVTGGACAIVEEISPPQSGPPPHLHRREDEVFYVLEGRLEFQCGELKTIAEPGTTLFLPRNIPHSFRNIGDTPSRVRVTIIPAGFERFFAEVDRLESEGPPDLEAILNIANKYDLELIP